MKKLSQFSSEHLEAICQILADTDTGFTGAEIGHILNKCHIPDVSPEMKKWKRLYNALCTEQNRRQYGNHVAAFIHKAMNPALHASNPTYFESKRAELNRVLAFAGLELAADGRLALVTSARTISEAEARAGKLKMTLASRNVHPDVLSFCRAELLQDNYFHAVLEATKSVADKIRAKAKLTGDGAELIQKAFSGGYTPRPLLAINLLSTDTERSEQKGFMNLLIGVFGMFRNPHAHAARIYWPIAEQDALDILSLISLIHRKLDNAQ